MAAGRNIISLVAGALVERRRATGWLCARRALNFIHLSRDSRVCLFKIEKLFKFISQTSFKKPLTVLLTAVSRLVCTRSSGQTRNFALALLEALSSSKL